MITFENYLAKLPLLHTWDGGQTWNNGGFEPHLLRRLYAFLRDALPPSPFILKTGAGNTTITLAFLHPAHHTVVCPDTALLGRIERFCQDAGLSTDHLDVRPALSEWVLPELAARTRDGAPPLHFGLIDGGHNWPIVFVDFCYVNFMLRQGGYLLIDDLQLHSVKELGRCLAEEPGFELALDLGKSLVFRKTTEARQLGEWNESPYILRLSEENLRRPNPFALEPAFSDQSVKPSTDSIIKRFVKVGSGIVRHAGELCVHLASLISLVRSSAKFSSENHSTRGAGKRDH